MIRDFSVYDMFQRNARLFHNETALVEKDLRLTFGELLKQTDMLAAGLAGRGIAKGERIAVLANNHHRFFLLFGACAKLGAIVVPINWRLSADEIRYILQDCSPKILFTDSTHSEKARELKAESVFDLDTINELMRDISLTAAPLTMDDAFCLIYTAAVDGKPRGACLTQGNIVIGNTQTAATMGLTRQDACLNMLPLFHITGINLGMGVMHVGGKNVVIEKFDEKISLELTEKEKISVMGSFPPILSRLTAEMEKKHYDLSSLRIVLGIDGPDNIVPFEQKTKAKFWILYGQSETTGLVTFSPASEKLGSAGKQGLLMKMRLIDENDQDVPAGESGEIAVQGPLVFKGYWNQEELNRKTFRNGWHHTGDLGQLDDAGYLWFKGRKPEKELIKPGGENVYPAEVEEVILRHPAVAAVCVIGVPDSQFGEGIKAICVTKPGEPLTAQELTEFVAARIARYKKPKYIEFVSDLPKTAGGVVDRQKVKALYGKILI
ncbi:MAG: AMP-dependent synthetase [Desulfobacteraceae bacterium IS3]|nr:MAG: AMP-dependent synthetase [Desulfobacteraceae bacterium IS3]